MSEQQLTAAIISAINGSRMAYVWRSQAGTLPVRGRYVHLAPNGCPDIVGYMTRGPFRGRFVGIEVKQPGKKTSDEQETWRAELLAMNCVYGLVNTVSEALDIVKAMAS